MIADNTNLISNRIERATELVKAINIAEQKLDLLITSDKTHKKTSYTFFQNHNENSSAFVEYPENFAHIIGDRIKQRREFLGITQKELSETTQIRRPNIARLEKGINLPNVATLIKISTGLKTSLDFFLQPKTSVARSITSSL